MEGKLKAKYYMERFQEEAENELKGLHYVSYIVCNSWKKQMMSWRGLDTCHNLFMILGRYRK